MFTSGPRKSDSEGLGLKQGYADSSTNINTNATSTDQHIEVGTALKSKQTEWSELLQYSELVVQEIPENKMRDITARCQLAALYFMDAVKGRRIDYPQSLSEMWFYKYSRSSLSLKFFSLVTFIDMVLPFFTQPYCPWTSDRDNNGRVDVYGSSNASNYINRNIVWAINVLSLSVYYFEVSTRFYTGYSVRTWQGYFADRWLLFRVAACVALTADYWGSHGSGGVYTMSSACIPFIYISRRHSLRQIVEGVIFAARKCVDVFLLLIFLIVLWSFVGYMIFHNIEVDPDLYSKFDTLSESFYMCLQTYATRSFLPFVLQPYYEVNPASTLFFVSLTIITDLLCSALIIATGNRQYRVHANNVFDELLRCRKQAVVAAYQLLCLTPRVYDQTDTETELDKTPNRVNIDYLKTCFLSRERWLLFCQNIPNTHVSLTEEKLHMLFNLECHLRKDDQIGLESFFKLCAILDANFFIGLNEETTRALERQEWLQNGEGRGLGLGLVSHDREGQGQGQWSRASSTEAPRDMGSFLGLSFSSSSLDGSSASYMRGSEQNENSLHRRSSGSQNGSGSSFHSQHKDFGRDSVVEEEGEIGDDELGDKFERPAIASVSRTLPKQLSDRSLNTSDDGSPGVVKTRKKKRRFSIIQTQNKKEELMREQVKRQSLQKGTTTTATTPSNAPAITITPQKKFKESSWHVFKIIQLLLRYCLAFTVTIYTDRFGRLSVNIFDTVVVINRLLLVATQMAISYREPKPGWYELWWLLEFYFWSEMAFLLLACGWKKYIKDRGLGIPIVVNIMSLTLMSMTNRDTSRLGTVYILTVLTQSVRLPSLIMQYKAAAVFNSIIPLVFRVIFIIFAVIYFYSALTLNRFCGVLNADLVNEEIENGVDDFISPWVTYSHQLNFRTIGNTLFTMFEISILGNWSSIMNSARKEETFAPLFFFFFFRLTMLLCIYPILNSFIIAAYIIRKDLQEKQLKEMAAAQVLSDQRFHAEMEQLELMQLHNAGGDIELGDMTVGKALFSMEDLSTNSKLEINISDVNSDSMISFWSGSGTERFIPKATPTTTTATQDTTAPALPVPVPVVTTMPTLGEEGEKGGEVEKELVQQLRGELEVLRGEMRRRERQQQGAERQIESLQEQLKLKEHQA